MNSITCRSSFEFYWEAIVEILVSVRITHEITWFHVYLEPRVGVTTRIGTVEILTPYWRRNPDPTLHLSFAMETSDDKYPRLTRILSKSCPFSTQGFYPWEPGGIFSSIAQFKRTTINPFQSSSIHVCYLRDFASIYIPGLKVAGPSGGLSHFFSQQSGFSSCSYIY